MNLIIFAALIAAGGGAKLDRSYLPPASAATAGGGAGNLQLPFSRSNQVSQEVPVGGFVNDDEGVVVDAAPALAGVRASNQQSGLGGPRISYGSTASKVGEAAFKVTAQNQGFLNEFGEPDLSAFHKPPTSASSSSGNLQIIRDPSHTLNYQNDIDIDKFNYGFETNNGIKVAHNGIDINGIQSQGAFSYFGDDGKQYSVSFTADKNGYRPQGSHLPTPPPIPPEILLSLERNAKDEAAGIFDNGSYDALKYNAQGDYTKNDGNGKYNDRQSNEFGNRPVFASGFINQHQQAFVIPNYNGQFGYNTASKDSTFSKPDSSGFGSSLMQSANRFGSSDPINIHNMQEKNNRSPVSTINMMGSYNLPKPLSQQNFQQQTFQKPSFVRPSSYDVSNDGLSISSQSNSQSSSSPLNQDSMNNFGNGNKISSSFGPSYENKPQAPFYLDSLTNQQILNNQQSLNDKKLYHQNALSSSFMSSQPSTGNFGSQAIQQFTSSNQNDRPSESTGSSSFSSSSQNTEHSQNSNGFSSRFPTKQPHITLTTPLGSFGSTNAADISIQTENFKTEDSDITKIPQTSFTNKEIQVGSDQLTTIGDFYTSNNGTFKPSLNLEANMLSSDNFGSQMNKVLENTQQMAETSQQSGFSTLQLLSLQSLTTPLKNQDSTSNNQPHSADVTYNTQKPSYEGSAFVQPQAPDHSYLYNPPLKPFNTPSRMPGFTRVPSSQFNKVTPSLKPQTSNVPQTGIFSSYNQGGIGVTQAAISPFPSTIPIASSDVKQPILFNSRPSQTASLNTPSVSGFSQVSPTIASATAQVSTFPDNQKLSSIEVLQESQLVDKNPSIPTQQYTGEIYQYSKPTEALPTESQKQNELDQKKQEQSGFSTLQLFNLQSNLPTSQLEGQFNSPLSIQDSTSQSDKLQIGVQFNNGDFNNKGSSFPESSQDATSQYNIKPVPSVPGKIPNQQIPSGPQSPTKAPVMQAIPDQFNKFNMQTTQFETKENIQFNQNGAIVQNIGTQSNFRPLPYLPPLSENQSVGLSSQKPVADFSQSSFSISSLPSTQIGNQQTSTTFESGSFNNKETTTPQFQQFGSLFGSKSSTQNSNSLQTQFSGFNTQSTTPQFVQPTTPNLDDLLTNAQFGQPSDSKTTNSQFETSQQSTTPFRYPSTIPPSTSVTQTTIKSPDFGEIYDYKKPVQGFISSSKNEDNSQLKQQIGVQFNTQFGQQDLSSTQKSMSSQFMQPSATVQLGENTISTSGYLSTNTPLQSTQLSTQFGQYSGTKTTTTQFDIDQQSTTSFNEPSTRLPNIVETQKPLQSSDYGEIYDYKKPAQGFISSSKKEDNSQIKPHLQFSAQSTTQFGQQDLTSTQNTMSSQFMQPASTVQFGENTKSTLAYLSTNTPFQSSQPNTQFGQYSDSKMTTSQFDLSQKSTTSSNEQSTVPPSTLETQTPSQNSELGGIYDYKKPAQESTPSFSSFSSSQFSISSFNDRNTVTTNVDKTEYVTPESFSTNPSTQDIQYTSSTQNSDGTSQGEIYNYQKPEQDLSIPSDKEGNVQFGQKMPLGNNGNKANFEANQQTTYQIAEPTTTLKPFTQETTQRSFETRPPLSFHRACCRGSIFNKEPFNLNISSSTDSFDQSKASSSQKETGIEQSPDNEKFEPQKSQFAGVPEQFGAPRKPPSFDATGYHY